MSAAQPTRQRQLARRRERAAHKPFVYRLEQFGLIMVWLLLIAVFGYLRPDTFLTWPNFSTILGSQAVLVVVTLGLIIPLTANDFDLSIAFIMTLSSMMVAVLNVNYGIGIGWAVLAALALGLVVGLINGLLITIFRIHSLIVTLGTGTFLHGFTLWMSDSMTISGISPSLMNAVIVDRLFGIPLEFYYAIVLAALVWYLLEYTALGRRILFVGRGREVARLSGINTDRIRVACLVASGFFGASPACSMPARRARRIRSRACPISCRPSPPRSSARPASCRAASTPGARRSPSISWSPASPASCFSASARSSRRCSTAARSSSPSPCRSWCAAGRSSSSDPPLSTEAKT